MCTALSKLQSSCSGHLRNHDQRSQNPHHDACPPLLLLWPASLCEAAEACDPHASETRHGKCDSLPGKGAKKTNFRPLRVQLGHTVSADGGFIAPAIACGRRHSTQPQKSEHSGPLYLLYLMTFTAGLAGDHLDCAPACGWVHNNLVSFVVSSAARTTISGDSMQ